MATMTVMREMPCSCLCR